MVAANMNPQDYLNSQYVAYPQQPIYYDPGSAFRTAPWYVDYLPAALFGVPLGAFGGALHSYVAKTSPFISVPVGASLGGLLYGIIGGSVSYLLRRVHEKLIERQLNEVQEGFDEEEELQE